MKAFVSLLLCIGSIFSEPIRTIPEELYDAFTENGSIKVNSWYLNDSYGSDQPRKWSVSEIKNYCRLISKGKSFYYGATDLYLYKALKQFPISGKSVAIIGSITPWYECVVLTYKGKPTTIEYNTIECDDPRIEIFTVEEFNANPKTFDCIISISSIEHDGLGRYGDPINPYGDFEAMQKCKEMLNPGGIFYLAVPVTEDSITFNAHRTYGKIRLPKLLSGWKVLNSYGFDESNFTLDSTKNFFHQPVFVLTADNS